MDNITKCIYMLISPSKKCYIGKTVNLKRRFKTHKLAKGGKILYQAIRKYGWDNFLKVIIEVFDDDVSNEYIFEREIYWIAKHGTMTPNGYNNTTGGEGCSGYKHTKEAKEQISTAKKDWHINNSDPEYRENVKRGQRQYRATLSKEQLQKHSFQKGHTINLGRKQSEETKEKRRRTHLARITPEIREKSREMARDKMKPVMATEIETGIKRKFDWLTQAAKTLAAETAKNITISGISLCANKKQKSHHGYAYEFVT